jgi:hypothetical protein
LLFVEDFSSNIAIVRFVIPFFIEFGNEIAFFELTTFNERTNIYFWGRTITKNERFGIFFKYFF